MKPIIIVASFILGTIASANPISTGFSQTLSCTVTDVDGQLDSFRPPVPGDTITVDGSQGSITAIDFDSGNMIPLLSPLQRYQNRASPAYLASYSATQDDSDLENISIVLMVGKFSDGSKDVYQGEVQVILTSKSTLLVSVGHVQLDCQPAQ